MQLHFSPVVQEHVLTAGARVYEFPLNVGSVLIHAFCCVLSLYHQAGGASAQI